MVIFSLTHYFGWDSELILHNKGLFNKHRNDQEKVQAPYMGWGGEGRGIERVKWCPFEEYVNSLSPMQTPFRVSRPCFGSFHPTPFSNSSAVLRLKFHPQTRMLTWRPRTAFLAYHTTVAFPASSYQVLASQTSTRLKSIRSRIPNKDRKQRSRHSSTSCSQR